MRRIVIVGISGTGKSVLGRRLAARTGLTLHPMDAILWGPNWTEEPETSVRAALSRIGAGDGWIVEGWVDRYSSGVLERAQVILWLDYPGWLAAWGGLRRWWSHRGRTRPEMPDGCVERLNLGFLWTMLLQRERAHIEAVLAETGRRDVLRVRSRRDTEAALKALLAGHPRPKEYGKELGS